MIPSRYTTFLSDPPGLTYSIYCPHGEFFLQCHVHTQWRFKQSISLQVAGAFFKPKGVILKEVIEDGCSYQRFQYVINARQRVGIALWHSGSCLHRIDIHYLSLESGQPTKPIHKKVPQLNYPTCFLSFARLAGASLQGRCFMDFMLGIDFV